MSIFAIILLLCLGLILLLIEFALFPGVTIAGIGGFLLLVISVYIAFVEYGTGIGFVTLIFVLFASPALIYYLFQSRTGKKLMLETLIDSKVESNINEKVQINDIGKTVGRLAPSGRVKIGGEVVDALSTGGFIDQNTEVKVIKILSNKIIVEPVNKLK